MSPPRDPIRSSSSAEPTLALTPPGMTPDARQVDPNAPTMTPQAIAPGDTHRPGLARAPRAEELPAPASIGRFTVLRELGRGGTGVVYAAFDEQLDRKVAVKLLHSETREDLARVRLLREAQAMARLSHPNIVGVHEVGTFGNQVYVAMEFVHGMTLHAWLKRQRRSFADIAAMFRQAGEGLAAAHAAGLVHRDFKPANVMVGDDGRVRVLDFGLARAEVSPGAAPGLDDLEPAPEHGSALANLRSLDASITLTGLMLGTPAYMAPEQFIGSRVDARSDQFAFCVSLFEATYRLRPFPGDTLAELMANVLAGVVADTPCPVGVPRSLRPMLLRGLARKPDDRWPAMRPLLDALAPMARPPARRAWFAAAGLAVALGSGGGVLAARGELSGAACSGGDERIAAVWNSEVRARVTAAAVDSGLAHADVAVARAQAGFDDYAEAWLAGYADACGESGALLDLRMTCLAERREALATSVGMFERLDAGLLARAEQVVADLPRVDACADEAYLRAKVRPPDDAATAEHVATLQTRLASAEMLERGGRLDEALKTVEAAIAEAPADYAPLRAELEFRRGALLEHQGRYEAARDALEAAFFFAVESAHHEVTIDAATRLAYIVGRRLGDAALSGSWLQHAQIYADRHGEPLRRARVSTTRGALLNARQMQMLGDPQQLRAEARAAFLDARRLFAEARAEDTADFARFLRFFGDHLTGSGDVKAGIDAERHSLALMQRLLGAQHPDVAMVHNSLGLALVRDKQLDAALATYQAGLDAAVDLENQRNHVYMTLWVNAAVVHEKLKDTPAAMAAMRASIAVLERSSSQLLAETYNLRVELAAMLMMNKQPAEADASLRETLASAEQAWGPRDPRLRSALLRLAAQEEEAGRPRDALALADRALDLCGQDRDKPYHEAQWTRANLLADLGDVDQALKLAHAVRTFAADLPPMEAAKWAPHVDKFINKHTAARGKR